MEENLMVLQKVVSLLNKTSCSSGKIQTVVSGGNNVCEMDMRGESNPEACHEDHVMPTATQNPSKHLKVLYRVSSLPLEVYSEVAKNIMHAQDQEQESAVILRKEESKTTTGWWWGCCWIGWLGEV